MIRAQLRNTVLARALMRRRGLRERVGLTLAVLILASSTGLAWGLAAYTRSSLVENAARELEALTRQTARELSYGMERFVREIELQARNPAFAAPIANREQMRQALNDIQRVHPEFAHISVVDIPSATVIAATGGIFEGGNGRGRPVFEMGQQRLFVADVHDAVKLADALPKPASGEPLRFLDAAAPIRGVDGQPIRVLASHLSWEWTSAIRSRVLDPVAASVQAQLMLVDTDGKLPLPPDRSASVGAALSELAANAPTRGVGQWRDGKEYLAAEAPTFATGSFPGLGWRVIARRPMESVLAPANRLRDLLLSGGILIGLLAGGLGWVVTGRIVKPVTDLARDAAAASEGHRLADAEAGNQVTEVAAVRKAFDRVTGESLRRAERLLSELNAVYQNAPVALCVVSSDLRYVRVNAVWADAFDVGRMPVALLDTHAPAGLVDAVKAALGGTWPKAVEVETHGDEGPRTWQTVLAPLHKEGGVSEGVSIVATDITAVRRAERELREADQRKNQFVSMLAHELRNPLAPIASAVEVLDRNPPQLQAARMRDMIRNQVRRMTRLIDDLLDVSRITHGKVTMKMGVVSLRDVIEAASTTARPLIDAKRQHLALEVDDDLPDLRGDQVRLEQVVWNLLTNASKYGFEGGKIVLRAWREGSYVHLAVQDDGQGISEDFLPRVFDIFAQGHLSIDRPDGGLGIGLTLVRTLVDLHGGEVKAESSGPGQGALFTVKLPCVIDDEQAVLTAGHDGVAPTIR